MESHFVRGKVFCHVQLLQILKLLLWPNRIVQVEQGLGVGFSIYLLFSKLIEFPSNKKILGRVQVNTIVKMKDRLVVSQVCGEVFRGAGS